MSSPAHTTNRIQDRLPLTPTHQSPSRPKTGNTPNRNFFGENSPENLSQNLCFPKMKEDSSLPNNNLSFFNEENDLPFDTSVHKVTRSYSSIFPLKAPVSGLQDLSQDAVKAKTPRSRSLLNEEDDLPFDTSASSAFSSSSSMVFQEEAISSTFQGGSLSSRFNIPRIVLPDNSPLRAPSEFAKNIERMRNTLSIPLSGGINISIVPIINLITGGVAVGKFSWVYLIQEGQPQVFDDVTNDHLVVKLLKQQPAKTDLQAMLAHCSMEYKKMKEELSTVNSTTIPLAQFFNVDKAPEDGFCLFEKVDPISKATDLWDSTVKFEDLSLKQKRDYATILTFIKLNDNRINNRESEMDLKPDNFGYRKDGNQELVFLDPPHRPLYYTGSYSCDVARKFSGENPFIYEALKSRREIS